jgi:hypothetical protein
MKEYHLHKAPLPDGAEQVFISGVVRNSEDQTLTVEEIFVVTVVGNCEVKARIDITNLMEKIAKTPGGNIPVENYNKMYEMIDPVTPTKVQLQNQIDLYQHLLEPTEPVDTVTDDFIFAADMAAACHATDFDTILEELLNASTSRKR